MTTRSLALVIGLISSSAACAPDPVLEPTWVDDVRPILVANCIRCHDGTPSNEAPATFRLDVLEDVDDMKGARSMAEFVASRTRAMGDMPPEGPRLSERQKEVLWSWQFTTEGGKRPHNAPPEVALLVIDQGEETAVVDVLVTDGDGDLVIGTLKSDGAVVATLRSGPQQLTLDTTGMAAGDRALSAIVDDGDGAINVDLGVLHVAHGNAVPTVEITSPQRDDLFVAGETTKVVMRATDADGREPLRVDVKAVRDGAGEVVVASGVEPELSGLVEVPFDTTGLAEGDAWRIEATVSDGKSSRTVRSKPFIVSHGSTTESYATMRPVINEYCRRCHSAHLPTGPNFDVFEQLQKFRGKAWRKVLQLHEMPPKSMRVIFPDLQFSDEDRERLGTWFYAGAPE
jgi:hypothetical protein